MKTISIKGTGNAKRDPDLVIFRIQTSARQKEYSDAVEASNVLVNTLKGELESLGFDGKDLKTITFDTRPIFEHVEVGIIAKKQERQLHCFEVNHDLKLEFGMDNDRINDVIKCLKGFRKDIQFDIGFSVSDTDSIKREVIMNATKNARFNAEILAEASGVKLGDLIKIEYNWHDVNFISRSDIQMRLESYYDANYMEFNPDSIEISDDVLFVWQIS